VTTPAGPYYVDESVTLHHGDCLDVLRGLPDNSVDAVVTDPPYGLEFMGKDWDKFGVGKQPKIGEPDGSMFRRNMGTPSYTANGNPTCRNCGGDKYRNGRRKCSCPSPNFGNPQAESMRGFGRWCELWTTECLRVLKPGGHLLAFGGTRTWHRLAVAVEDAGFEVRDSIAWLSGSGFPKSLNVNKDARFCRCDPLPYNHADSAVRGMPDAVPHPTANAAPGEVTDVLASVQRKSAGPRLGEAWAQGLGGSKDEAGYAGLEQPGLERRGDAQAPEGQLHGSASRSVPTGSTADDGSSERLHRGTPAGNGAVDRSPADPLGVREPHQPSTVGQQAGEPGSLADERRPQAWRGWPLCAGCGKPRIPAGLGTALKPAHEPIVVARKPLTGTVAANVLVHGTGGLNIDGCRVGTQARSPSASGWTAPANGEFLGVGESIYEPHTAGRWPANVLLDGDAAAELDAEVSTLKSGANLTHRGSDKFRDAYGDFKGQEECTPARGADSGGPSRFFPIFKYAAKAPAWERPSYVRDGDGDEGRVIPNISGKVRECNVCGNRTIRSGETEPACGHSDYGFVPTAKRSDRIVHPTCKPLELMRWLTRLVTPPGGTILDPFAGSGTTVEAAIIEGFRCVAVEREADYLPLILARMQRGRAAVKARSVTEALPPTAGQLNLFTEGTA
jgi:DNA modification methylase